MKLSKFKFNLPSELIALHPAKNRDESRLMVDRAPRIQGYSRLLWKR